MKFTLWAPEFKDLPTVVLHLPPELSKKTIQILYGYTQPSKPYDRTLFLHLVTPVKTSRAQLRKLTTQLRNLVKKNWDKTHYKIVDIKEDYKSYQSFIYFQLKREQEVISSKSLATPLKITRKELLKSRSHPVKKRTHRKSSKKKTTKRKVTKKKSKGKTRRKVTKKKTTKRKSSSKRKTTKKTTRKKSRTTRKKTTRKRTRRR